VEVDGVVVGTSTTNSLKVPKLKGGLHRWRVVAVDRHGQQTPSPTRILRIDGGAPRLKVSVAGRKRHGSAIRVAVRASDRKGKYATGLKGTRIDFGDGSKATAARRAVHFYSRAGTYTLVVTATDKAGNQTVVRRRLTIR
jgi:hypothetical protein